MSNVDSISNMSALPLMEMTDTSRTLRSSAQDPRAVSVAQDFESVFASMLLKEMRQSLEPGSLFPEDSGDVYGGLFDRFMGEELTKGRGLGLTPLIREGIARQQRIGSNSSDKTHDAPHQVSG